MQALTVIGAVASVGGTLAQMSAQRKSAALQMRQENLATRRSQRQAIREAQIRRAQALASAGAMGAGGGSSIAGGVGALGSQLGGSLGFSNQMSGLSAGISSLSQRANTYGAIADFGNSLFQFGSERGGLGFLLPQQQQATVPSYIPTMYPPSGGR